ncbi:non-ribosomal peptide synthetase [Bradyrhizobium sp. 170]|uniref:non-ribosomal peptide synthetase n=1 Tax=Bradyrhizobium sp. 170 TaxID=2782641 RepID=UPI001FFE7A74|nr:non-ribosomal peptide synthetase [Bradyrhizobium sp. 170]UPK01077.1 amino acid adenylation domain-containing protein [Bradyrhizobium sp. 170]
MADSLKPDLRELDAEGLRKLLSLARDRSRSANRGELASIPAVPRDGPLALSFAQQRLWLLAQLDGTSTNYHIRGALRLAGDLDVTAWRRSLDRLFARHESLRSIFRVVDGQPCVELLPTGNGLPLLEHDVRSEPEREQVLERLCREETNAPFDLCQGPLIRGRLIRIAEREYLFLLTQHHIVSDGWSMGVLVRELGALYRAFIAGEGDPLPALTVQYPDYAAWQRQWLAGERLQRQVDYWRQTLAGAPALLELPTDRPRPPIRSLAGASLPVEIDTELARGIKRLYQSHRTTAFMTVLAAWAAVLSRLSGQSDVVIGTPTANRNRREIEGLVGFFVNMLAFRVDLSGEPDVAELLSRVRGAALAAQDHQDLPFEQVVEIIQPPRRLDHTPVFQVVFAWQNNEAAILELPGLKAEIADIPLHQVKFDLELNVSETDGRIIGALNYATALFDEATVRRHRSYLLALLRAMVADAGQLVDRIDVMGAEERELLLGTWNRTATPYPSERCIHELFAEQVRKAPEATALVHEDLRVSYGELDARANQLAHHLIGLGAGPDQPVAICLERGIAMVVSLLAVLKAGGAYLPLDPAYPAERLRQIIDDAKPKLLICDDAGRAALANTTCEIVDLQTSASVIAGLSKSNPDVADLTSSHLAYIIYTSGSTGTPKGVMVEHRGLVNLALAQSALLEVSSRSRIVQFASFSFDASTWEIVMALCSGAELFLVGPREHRNASELLDYLARNAITHATLPPALLQGRTDLDTLGSLQVLVLAGELPKAELFKGLPSNVAVFNGYGPTEATVCATIWLRPMGCEGVVVPIGRPLPNTRIYLLDRFGAPVPLGATGEIYIGGAGVARGYLNRADLTAERFLFDPFSRDAGARMYRTGDLGRYLPDGNVEFLGRNDHQVKIRGFRIELGEIEFRLNEHAGVADAVVLARQDHSGDQRLVAYVVPAADDDSTGLDGGDFAAAMRGHLRARLPEYMVPSAFVRLDTLPLTPNGKVDRQALAAPEDDAFVRRGYETPEGEIEETVAKIWTELLGVDRIGRNDHFFELGGHSLLAVRLLERLQRHSLSADVRTLFAKPVLADFAASLDGDGVTEVPANQIPMLAAAITPGMLPLITLEQSDIDSIAARVPGGAANIQDIYGLSPLQDGILFHHLLAAQGDPYLLVGQMAFASRDLLDRYLAAVRQVIDRHDILRTSIEWEGLSTPAQVVWRQAPLIVTEVELDVKSPAHEQLAQRFDPRRNGIDLGQAPLLRFAVARDPGKERWLLLVLLHHLIGDHSTLEVMHDEVRKILSGRGHELPHPYPFRNLVAQTRDSEATAEHERFFRNMLSDIDEPTTPFGLDKVHGDGRGVAEARRTLPQSLNERLRAQARRLGVGLASLCHLAWGQVVARSSGRERVVFGTVLFGRMHAGTGGDRTMGLFINTLPLRLDLDDAAVEDGARHAHARLAELISHEHASLALAQRCSGVATPAPLFSSILNYRHNAMPTNSSAGETAAGVDGIEWLGGEERTNYPLMLSVEDCGQALGLTAQVVHPLSPDRVCALMQHALEQLAENLERRPHALVRQVDILPPEERELLLETWNRTLARYPRDRCFHEQFEEQVRRFPDAVALVFGDAELSYGELNRRANRLARGLRDYGVGTDVVVGLALDRGVGMMVALLAVLKAGGAYLPLDPDYPPERLAHMLRDSGAALVLTQTSLLEQFAPVLKETGAEAWLLDEAQERDDGNLDVAVHPESLAYVIYTSGSTGLPKGVMVRHDAVTNFLATMAERPGITPRDRVLGLTSLSFDIAVLELWLPLTLGARVVLADRAAAHDPSRLKAMVATQGVTMIQATPSTWRMLLDHDGPSLPISCRVLCGGEALAPDLARRLVAQAGEVWNLYGPSETTVWSARHRLDARDDRPVLGGPIGNTTLHILDNDLNLAPIGVAGELYIGGDGLARGYWQRGALTAERFIPDPFGPPGARLYRTGDVARWRADGVIEYIGRSDHQVKIRGFRIELGEIEARLMAQAAVRSAVVVAREVGAGRQLVGYVSGGASLDGSTLKTALSSVLPDYMVPARIVVLDRLPLTPNGKIDRKALPAPDQLAALAEHVAPRTPVEVALAAIWADLLRQPNIGVTDNFFELGGDSLTAVQLISRIKRDLGHDLPLHRLFEMTTIETMAAGLAPEIQVDKRSDDIAAMLDMLKEVELSDE